jgi:hypothetical protein
MGEEELRASLGISLDATPEEALAILDEMDKMEFESAQVDATRPSQGVPPSGAPFEYDEEATGGILNPANRMRALGNLPHDAQMLVENTLQAGLEPVKTGKAMFNTVAGMGNEASQRIADFLLGDNYKDFKEEQMPHLAEGGSARTPEAGMVLDDYKSRYIDNPGKTITEEPLQSLLDVIGAASPVARTLKGAQGVNALHKVNPLSLAEKGADKGMGFLQPTPNKLLGERPGKTESVTQVLTGQPITEARKIRQMGQTGTPEQVANLKRMLDEGVDFEPITETFIAKANKHIEGAQSEVSAKIRESIPQYKLIGGEYMLRNLASGLTDIKAGLSDALRKFNINPKGRSGLAENLQGVREKQSTPTMGFKDTKTVRAEDMTGHPYLPIKDPASTSLGSQSTARAKFIGQLTEKEVPTDAYVKPPTVRGRNLSGSLDDAFTRTGMNTPDASDAQLGAFKSVVNDVLMQERALPEDLIALKGRIKKTLDDYKAASPSTTYEAFATPIYKAIDDLLKQELKGKGDVPDYADYLKEYKAIQSERKKMADVFALDAGIETQMQKLLTVFGDSPTNEVAQRIFKDLVDSADSEILPAILAKNWGEGFGSGLIPRQAILTSGRQMAALGGTGVGATVGTMVGGPVGGVVGGMAGSGLGLWGTLKVTTPKNMANFLLKLGKHERVGDVGKLGNISKTLNHLYEQAKATGIPIEGLTYSEILQRLEVPERVEQETLLDQIPPNFQR